MDNLSELEESVDGAPEPATPVVAASGRGAVTVPAATIGANLLSYLLLLAAARVLTKSAYGETLAELGVLLVGNVAALALQTVAARRTATGSRTDQLYPVTLAVAAAGAVVLALLAPLLQRFLHLDAPYGLLAVAAALPATAILGTYQGINQGYRHFGRLAVVIGGTTGGRSAGGLVGVLVGRSPFWCLVGVAVGTSVALAGVWWRLGRPDGHDPAAAVPAPRTSVPTPGAATAAGPTIPGSRRPAPPPTGSARDLLAEVAHAAHAHGTFLLLTSLDVLLARHVLDPDAAGVYAAGSVVTRAALWLPQSVAMIMFAALTDHTRHRRTFGRAVAVVGALGAASVLGCLILGPLVVSVVGGGAYHGLDDDVWLFAALGAALALTQLVILAGLALGRRARIALVWTNAVADVVAILILTPQTPRDTVVILTTITAVLAAACLLVGARSGLRPRR